LALEVACKLQGSTADGRPTTVTERVARVIETARLIEADLLKKEREFELATMPYPDYLQTPEWQARAGRVKSRRAVPVRSRASEKR
jgi:hypothetical protein